MFFCILFIAKSVGIFVGDFKEEMPAKLTYGNECISDIKKRDSIMND